MQANGSMYFFTSALLTVVIVQAVVAQITLGPVPDVVSIGKEYTLNWRAAANYTYNIWLIRDDSVDDTYDWSKVQGVASGLHFDSLNPSYSWIIPTNISINDTYAFWFSAGSIPFNGATTSATTNWFKLTTSKRPASSTSASATTTATSGAGTSRPEKDGGSGGVSGGTIAGIVIGCVIAVAVVAGGSVFLRRRRSRSTPDSREAEARAARLEPVMQEGYPSYEMNRTASRA